MKAQRVSKPRCRAKRMFDLHDSFVERRHYSMFFVSSFVNRPFSFERSRTRTVAHTALLVHELGGDMLHRLQFVAQRVWDLVLGSLSPALARGCRRPPESFLL